MLIQHLTLSNTAQKAFHFQAQADKSTATYTCPSSLCNCGCILLADLQCFFRPRFLTDDSVFKNKNVVARSRAPGIRSHLILPPWDFTIWKWWPWVWNMLSCQQKQVWPPSPLSSSWRCYRCHSECCSLSTTNTTECRSNTTPRGLQSLFKGMCNTLSGWFYLSWFTHT